MDAFNRCKELGGKVKVQIIDTETGEKRRVCFGAKSKNKKGKIIEWGPVAESKVFESPKKKKVDRKKKVNKKSK